MKKIVGSEVLIQTEGGAYTHYCFVEYTDSQGKVWTYQLNTDCYHNGADLKTVEEVKAETVPVRPYIPTNAELYEQNIILMSALADIYAKQEGGTA